MWQLSVYRDCDARDATNRRGGLVFRKVVYEWWWFEAGKGQDKLYYRGRMFLWFSGKRAMSRLIKKSEKALRKARLFQEAELRRLGS